jgi:hypothetical protein
LVRRFHLLYNPAAGIPTEPKKGRNPLAR